MMFEIGDLVKFRKEGVVTLMRTSPYKKIGLITNIQREAYLCYSGDMDDRITVIWLGANEEETLPEFYLEKVDEDT
jgi:hypothetical protein